MMETNVLPKYDMSDNPTGCCPRFKPAVWDEQELHFKEKLFVKATTLSVFHIPLNMGSVFPKTFDAIKNADANSYEDFIVLSYDVSPWKSEHFFSVIKDVPGEEMIRMTGDFITKVFEGPYKNVPKWEKEMESFVQSRGKEAVEDLFFLHHLPKVCKVLR